ncbi:MAG: membrane dipeptidase [Syntrophobacteraceae bacterium]|nr:membrane dipeptidase [Syntrophobacteraceae bacterium]
MLSSPQSIPIVDGHVDILFELRENHPGKTFREITSGSVTLGNLIRGNVRVIVSAIYCADQYNGEGSSANHFKELVDYAQEHLDGLIPLRTSQELLSAYESGGQQPATLFLLENADALVDLDVTELDALAIRVVGLTHAGKNRIGDGNGIFLPGGLTREGKRVIQRLREVGWAVDVAHLSDPCFWELMDLFDGPLVASHTGFRFFCDTPRNLTKDQVRTLVERRAVIGISVNSEMLSIGRQADEEDVFRHIDWMVQSFGCGFVALGSDYCGSFFVAEGLEDISRLSVLADRMVRDGYPPEAVRAVMGGNWVRIYSNLF